MALGGEREQVFLGEEIGQHREYSEATAREVDEEVRAIVEEAYERALGTLRENRAALDRVAQALLAKEEIPGDEVLELVGVSEEEARPEPETVGSDTIRDGEGGILTVEPISDNENNKE